MMGRKPFIIVIDDDELVSEVIQAHIANQGYKERSFSHPDEALAYFEKYRQDVDAAIIDLTLPGMTGADLARTFFDIKPDLCTILVTGHLPETLSVEQKEQFHRIIYKPFTKEDLFEAIDSIMGKICAISQ